MSSIFQGIAYLFRNKISPPKPPTTPFTNKTILLTGGTAGLGLEAAIHFASLNCARLIIGARNPTKAAGVKSLIEARSKCGPGVVEMWELDMARSASVKAFAERVDRDVKRLDVALLNAGVNKRRYELREGWEETVQVNLLGTALLALLLLPKLRASSSKGAGAANGEGGLAHLTLVSSGTHRGVKEDWVSAKGSLLEALNDEKNFSGMRQYATSKLYVEYVNKALADLTRDPRGEVQVTVDSCCPGLCQSDLSRDYSGVMERFLVSIFFYICGRTSEQGSRTLVTATEQGVESHGRWWKNDGYPETGKLRDGEKGDDLGRRVWAEVLEVLGEKVPEVRKIVDA